MIHVSKSCIHLSSTRALSALLLATVQLSPSIYAQWGTLPTAKRNPDGIVSINMKKMDNPNPHKPIP